MKEKLVLEFLILYYLTTYTDFVIGMEGLVRYNFLATYSHIS